MSIESTSTEPDTGPSRREWLGLIAVSLGVALIVVDMTIVNVIVAPIVTDLSITSSEAQWVQESYAIVFAALLLFTGRLADLYGARRLFLLGLGVFGATSLFAALAPSGELLILARFLQGIGGAMMLPTSLTLINVTFTGPDRAKAFAVWGSTIGAAAAVGPLLGGWLADFSWRWAFGINIPLGAVIAAGVLLYLPVTAHVPGRVDGVGATLSALGLGFAAFGLIEGRTYGWLGTTEPFTLLGFEWTTGPSPALVAFVIAAVALVAFWRRQVALIAAGAEPLMDTRLFRIGSFRNGNVVTLVVGIGEFGVIAVLPMWLQFTLGYSAVQAGLALVALAVGSFLASGASFSLTASLTALTQVRIGLLLEAAGLGLLGLFAATDSRWWLIASTLLIYGVGVGFATAQVTNVVLAEVPVDRAGQGSGVQSAARELGSALGIAAVTTVFFSALDSGLRSRLGPEDEPLATAVSDSAGALIPALSADPHTEAAAAAARAAMTSGIQIAAYLCAGLLLLALATTAFMPNSDPAEQKPVPQQ